MAKGVGDATVDALNVVSVNEAFADARLDGEGALTQQIYRLLRRLIVGLTLLPNQFLSEKDVASCLAISKTPVREAFIRLAEDGIVRIVPKSGTYVAPIDIERAREGYFVRNALETSCAAQAAELANLGDVRRLRELLGQQKAIAENGGFSAFAVANDRFHSLIFEIADLPDAGLMIDAARFEIDRIQRLRDRYDRRSIEDSVAEHSGIVNAIALHDAEAARDCMERHLKKVQHAVEALAGEEEMRGVLEFLNQKRPGTRRSRGERNG
jgi:Transcriptional regulators